VRIVVVGAGIVGLACGYELLQDGHDVVVVDTATAGQAASHGNAAKIAIAEAGPVPAPGMVLQGLKWMLRSDSPLYVRPSLSPRFLRFMIAMARNCTEQQFRAGLALNLRHAAKANDLFDEWQNAGMHFEMHQRGVLLAYENTDHFEDRLRYQDVFSAYGAEPDILDATGVHDVEPALSDRIQHGLFYPEDRQIEPDSLTAALVAHITKLGGSVHETTSVVGFDRGLRGVEGVRTNSGDRLACDGVVLAAGVWTGPLSAKLGVPVPIRPGKGYSVDYRPAPFNLRTSLTFEDARVAVTPLNGVIRVAGTMEFSGYDNSINPTRIAAIKRAAAEGFGNWDPEAPHDPAWTGMRPMTPDGLPAIGPLVDGANVWVASGHGMLGLTLAPTTARTIRQLVRGETTSDPETSPARFHRRARRTARRRAGNV
jgi:D-amino-acid dehydrogenase